MQATPHVSPNRVGRFTIVATGLFTAFVLMLAIAGEGAEAALIMAPFWLMTVLVGVGSYFASDFLSSAAPEPQLSIDLTVDDRAPSEVQHDHPARLDESTISGDRYGFCSGRNIELHQDRCHMVLDGPWGQEELIRDLGIRQAFG